MLYLALCPALVLLLLARRAARPHPLPTPWTSFLVGGGLTVGLPGCVVMFCPVNIGLFLLLGLALLVWPLVRRRVPSFTPLAAVAFVTAYGFASWSALKERAEAERLRALYPVESMADRVPEPRGDRRSAPAQSALAQLDRLEQDGSDVVLTGRAYQLRALHERTVGAFVNSPGFGVARMVPLLTEEGMRDRPERPEAPAQPGAPSAWPPDAPFQTVPSAGTESHRRMHTDAVLDFVNPRGWGYVADRRRAAGFLRHAFSRVPEPAPEWQVEAVELIGLLRHPEPVVYRSDRLPAMADLGDAPTRPLDRFEVAALAAVRAGEDGYAARWGTGLRFVGGIRSARQCVSCHGGERGDLLGAFGYSLRAAPR